MNNTLNKQTVEVLSGELGKLFSSKIWCGMDLEACKLLNVNKIVGKSKGIDSYYHCGRMIVSTDTMNI